MSVETMPTNVEVLPPPAADRKPQETSPAPARQRWYFAFFFISGFCSILYELIWLRLAMAQFGVTTAMVSIVLSGFMAGLGAGSLAAGRLVRKYGHRFGSGRLRLYAIAELLIGVSAVVVPLELHAGRFLLEHVGSRLALTSSGYYIASGVWLLLSLMPWCACMGATIPLGMFALQRDGSPDSRRSFSFFYLANVLGAVAGALIPLLCIEAFGFSGTLRLGMALNFSVACASLALAARSTSPADRPEAWKVGANRLLHDDERRDFASPASPETRHLLTNGTLWLLFATGLTSMGMEVVWTRQYTPFVGTFVYSFATILGSYLAATFIGSTVYRIWSRRHTNESSILWALVWLSALVPLLSSDPRVQFPAPLRVPLGIAAFSALLGFITPKLVDRFSAGDPDRAGAGYAVNVAGCICGPLLAGFGLLPWFDERAALVLLALPWLLVALWSTFSRPAREGKAAAQRASSAAILFASISASVALIVMTQSYVHQVPSAQVRRDSTATVIAAGEGMQKRLFVNGVSMTILTPSTKLMASLPLAFLDRAPQNALVICFGMGTTHRSMLSWGIESTAVELVPSVPALFGYYHRDGPELLKLARSHVVADDGRRFLERSAEQYDVIVIDPPPPVEAAGSSLLYSREFYAAAQKRLRPDGILQQWFPGGDAATTSAIARALKESFPYVRAFISIDGWGIHYLASRQPIPERSAADLARKMPSPAVADLVEWGPFATPEQQFAAILKKEVPVDRLAAAADVPALQDDRPVNEYNLLRSGHWPTSPTGR